ncbi:unnamed protein product [Calypogeia fissa]
MGWSHGDALTQSLSHAVNNRLFHPSVDRSIMKRDCGRKITTYNDNTQYIMLPNDCGREASSINSNAIIDSTALDRGFAGLWRSDWQFCSLRFPSLEQTARLTDLLLSPLWTAEELRPDEGYQAGSATMD